MREAALNDLVQLIAEWVVEDCLAEAEGNSVEQVSTGEATRPEVEAHLRPTAADSSHPEALRECVRRLEGTADSNNGEYA